MDRVIFLRGTIPDPLDQNLQPVTFNLQRPRDVRLRLSSLPCAMKGSTVVEELTRLVCREAAGLAPLVLAWARGLQGRVGRHRRQAVPVRGGNDDGGWP
jgi:hypothetical protein